MNDLRFLHICTIDIGGAYNGARRQHEMLKAHGISSKILVRTKLSPQSDCETAIGGADIVVSKIKNVINLMLKKGEVKRDRLGTDLSKHPLVKEADVIVLHWISTFLSPREIYKLSKLDGKKVVFFMHDMWLFTGGCHVDRRCGGYTKGCVDCPMAGKAAGRSFKYKKKWLSKADITLTGPSKWIVEEARNSLISEGKMVEYLPNTFDSKIFYPREDVASIKEKYGISSNKKSILFGAADTGTANSNKGFRFLLEALKKINMSDKQLVVIGQADGINDSLSSYDYVSLGFISDENELAEIYSAADVFVNPSLQESFGYTVCEAMACGTPAVAFGVGGMLDQIAHMRNGYLAEYQNSEELAKGIDICLTHSDFSKKAAQSALRFNYEEVFKDICRVYEQIR